MKINDFEVKSEEDILTVLHQVENDEEEFAVLDNGELNFIQTSGGELEYRDGEKQYRVADAPVSNEKIREAFLSYYRGDGKYRTDFNWELIIEKSLWETIRGWFRKD